MGKRDPSKSVPPAGQSCYDTKRYRKGIVEVKARGLSAHQQMAMDLARAEMRMIMMEMPDWADLIVDKDLSFFDEKAMRPDSRTGRVRLMTAEELSGTGKSEYAAGGDGFVNPGDTVIATRDGTRDKDGLPKDVPLAGCRYVVHSFYIAPYGVGVVLNNLDGSPLDNYPYRGYIFAKISNGQAVLRFKKDDEDEV